MKKLLPFIIFVFVFSLSKAQTMLDTAINFTVKDVNGNTIKLYDILNAGNLVVIDFYSTACGTCQQYAPDMQMAYEEFGCNSGNVFFMGIDKGNTNQDVMEFDSIYGVHYPNVSGQEGGGNQVHLLYEIQATPTTIVIQPDAYIYVPQIYPPSYANVVDSVYSAGGIAQQCLTSLPEWKNSEMLCISPNPVRNYVNIKLHLEDAKNLHIKIFNLTGQEVTHIGSKLYYSGKHAVFADLSGKPEGLYFVQLLENSTVISTQKLILTR
ncbi:MAG: redoxin domain-containing protein [Bacteroidales bacterium]|nr:redoxin domain-containing protein [Bacteroidales bacterium]